MLTATSSTPCLAAFLLGCPEPISWIVGHLVYIQCSADTPRNPNWRTLDKLYSGVNKCLKKRRQSNDIQRMSNLRLEASPHTSEPLFSTQRQEKARLQLFTWQSGNRSSVQQDIIPWLCILQMTSTMSYTPGTFAEYDFIPGELPQSSLLSIPSADKEKGDFFHLLCLLLVDDPEELGRLVCWGPDWENCGAMVGSFPFLGLALCTSGVRGILGLLVKAEKNSLWEDKERVSNAQRKTYAQKVCNQVKPGLLSPHQNAPNSGWLQTERNVAPQVLSWGMYSPHTLPKLALWTCLSYSNLIIWTTGLNRSG